MPPYSSTTIAMWTRGVAHLQQQVEHPHRGRHEQDLAHDPLELERPRRRPSSGSTSLMWTMPTTSSSVLAIDRQRGCASPRASRSITAARSTPTRDRHDVGARHHDVVGGAARRSSATLSSSARSSLGESPDRRAAPPRVSSISSSSVSRSDGRRRCGGRRASQARSRPCSSDALLSRRSAGSSFMRRLQRLPVVAASAMSSRHRGRRCRARARIARSSPSMRRAGVVLVVVAQQVQHAVHHQMARDDRPAACRPPRPRARTVSSGEHDVAEQRRPWPPAAGGAGGSSVERRERQHVGRLVLAAIGARSARASSRSSRSSDADLGRGRASPPAPRRPQGRRDRLRDRAARGRRRRPARPPRRRSRRPYLVRRCP